MECGIEPRTFSKVVWFGAMQHDAAEGPSDDLPNHGTRMSAADPVSEKWARLAVVARERATEQQQLATGAADSETAKPHVEQRAYLLRLAEVYERRRVAGRHG